MDICNICETADEYGIYVCSDCSQMTCVLCGDEQYETGDWFCEECV